MHNDKIITIEFENYLILDSITDFAREYSVSVDFLINAAVQRLIDDIEFFRRLRAGNIPIHHQDGQT